MVQYPQMATRWLSPEYDPPPRVRQMEERKLEEQIKTSLTKEEEVKNQEEANGRTEFENFLEGENLKGVEPIDDDDPFEEADADLTPEARKCPNKLRMLLRNVHRNLGHPGKDAMVRLLTLAKCEK